MRFLNKNIFANENSHLQYLVYRFMLEKDFVQYTEYDC